MILEPAAPLRAAIEDGPLDELANSIKEIGLQQPLVVRQVGEKFEVIAGHRRLLATRKIGLPRVPCLVVDQCDDDQVVAIRLHENIIRRDISPVEEAALYAELYEKLLDVDLVAKLVKRSRGVVEDRLALLAGDQEVMKQLQAGMISVGVAQQLNKVHDQGVRRYLLEYAVRDGASIEKVRNWRLQYAGVTWEQLNSDQPPITAPQPVAVENNAPKCYFCGQDDDQHDMEVLMVHRSCRKYIERQAANQQQPQEVTDGHQ